MSLLLKDSVYSKEATTPKRGTYPLHGFKLGLFRLPITLEEPAEIKAIHDGLKKIFEMDRYADRIYATYKWKEQNLPDPDDDKYEEVELSVTVEIVTGEVVDIIYQIFPIEKFGDPNWVKDYRKKADHFAKMMIDSILRNTILADKMTEQIAKSEKIPVEAAEIRLEEMTPLAQIVPDAKILPVAEVEEQAQDDAGAGPVGEAFDGPKPGPIDVEYKSHMRPSSPFTTGDGNKIKTWGRVGTDNARLGVWGEFVSVDYDICIADGACIDACPVGVYEWFDTPGHPASEKKPLMSGEADCINCLACESACPPVAIKIFEKS